MAQTTISVILTQSPTELYKILKFEGLSSSGAEAKIAIADGLVKVNGVIELQKRKKIVDGDVVEFAGTTINVSCEN
ncbi:MAG: RNA-binding S4 domain-containing protein [Pseudomonadota bacterium]|nr:RNA-binding S4 domain-containing protein [Pseudomonadota bacterium]MDO7711446.1 RNA-binding S4 domain-containing protein [Pseudomonadota bacterium]